MTSNERLVEAFTRGWRVTDAGVAIKPGGSPQPVGVDKHGYKRFSLKNTDGKIRPVMVHRLAAYQKFGDALFAPGIEVRHLNGAGDNAKVSIAIGSKCENAQDKDPALRRRVAGMAARKLTDSQVAELRADRTAGATYKQLTQKYGLQKSTISYIVRGMTCKI